MKTKLMIKKLKVGISNNNYYLSHKQNNYFIKKRAEHQITTTFNQENIYLNLKNYPNSLKPIFINKNQNLLIYKYLTLKTINMQNIDNYIINIATKLKNFHLNQPLSQENFNVQTLFNKWKVNNPLYSLDNFYYLLDDLYKYPLNTFCHNDLILDNIIYYQNQIQFIDFEYAANNYYMFDIVSFICENNLENTSLANTFILHYLGHYPDINFIREFEYFKKISHLLWIQWSNYKYHHTKHIIFQEIAKDKYQRLIKDSNF